MATNRCRSGPHNLDETYVPQAGVPVDYRSFETMGHSMHGQDPQLFTDTLVDWTSMVPQVQLRTVAIYGRGHAAQAR